MAARCTLSYGNAKMCVIATDASDDGKIARQVLAASVYILTVITIALIGVGIFAPSWWTLDKVNDSLVGALPAL